jgi:hypothetical protein
LFHLLTALEWAGERAWEILYKQTITKTAVRELAAPIANIATFNTAARMRLFEVAFFDHKDKTVTTPPENVPARSWKMTDETKRWVLAGHDVLNQASLTKQIEAAELQKLIHNFLTVDDRNGGFTKSSTG